MQDKIPVDKFPKCEKCGAPFDKQHTCPSDNRKTFKTPAGGWDRGPERTPPIAGGFERLVTVPLGTPFEQIWSNANREMNEPIMEDPMPPNEFGDYE